MDYLVNCCWTRPYTGLLPGYTGIVDVVVVVPHQVIVGVADIRSLQGQVRNQESAWRSDLDTQEGLVDLQETRSGGQS